MAITPPSHQPQQQDRVVSQSRLVRAIINPDEIISELLPKPKQRDNNASRLEESKIARVIGGTGFDYGIGGSPDSTTRLPASDEPLAEVAVDPDIQRRLPKGYTIRSLQREDFDNGYIYLKHVGVISREKWDRRCEYLRSRSDTYIVLVITNQSNWVVCSGTLVIERKFTHDLCLVGHIEDLLVGEGQSGKNLGGRMLEALDQVAKNLGCYKTMVGTNESNETFHEERNFKRAGFEMTHHHFAPRKTVPPRASSRDPSPEHTHYDDTEELMKKQAAVEIAAVSSLGSEGSDHSWSHLEGAADTK